jgi:hypothetical protein
MKTKIFTKKRILGMIIIAYAISVAVIAYAYPTGITGRTKKGPEPGCTCHDPSPSTSVNVNIIGPSTVGAGQTATYRVRISSGPLVRGGTNIAVKNGTIDVVTGSGLQKIGDELTHTEPKLPSGDTVSFSFTYTAPLTAGVDTLFANGNSVNFDNTNSGDMWNFASNKPVVIVPATGVGNSGTGLKNYNLNQNYPNPFNPVTRIQYEIPKSGNVNLKVYDVLGTEIKTLVSGFKQAGSYNVEFNAGNLASGIYYYKIQSGDYSKVMKMMLVK